MPFHQDDTQIQLQAKVFNFALMELVRQHRETFQPLWTVDSWVKFLIWMSLNSGLSGEKESLEQFAEALGDSLSIRMRQIFFERKLDEPSIKLFADPAEAKVLVMPIDPKLEITNEIVHKALHEVGLFQQVVTDPECWQNLDLVIAIPWQVFDK